MLKYTEMLVAAVFAAMVTVPAAALAADPQMQEATASGGDGFMVHD